MKNSIKYFFLSVIIGRFTPQHNRSLIADDLNIMTVLYTKADNDISVFMWLFCNTLALNLVIIN